MTKRERFIRTLKFQPVDRAPDFEFGAWIQTLNRWHKEGLPKEYTDAWDVMSSYFGSEDGDFINIGVNVGLLPGFESKLMEEKGDHIIIQDNDGAICEMMKSELGASPVIYLNRALIHVRFFFIRKTA